MKQTTIEKIAPLAERIVSLRAAADFQFAAAEILEDGTVQGANAAQAKLNKADAYNLEANELQVQARAIAQANGDRLLGYEALKALAARV